MKEIDLTGIVAEHIDAINAGDTDRAVATFAEDAYVNDNRREFVGIDAIRRWVAKEMVGDKVRIEVREVLDHYGDTVVRGAYDGTFDRTNLPDEIVLTNYFSVRDGKIVSLVDRLQPARRLLTWHSPAHNTKLEDQLMARLAGKVAVITGGSSGIGLATAQRFVDEGAHVFIMGRRRSELDKAKALIGNGLSTVAGDVTNSADLDKLFADCPRQRGRLGHPGGEFGPGGGRNAGQDHRGELRCHL